MNFIGNLPPQCPPGNATTSGYPKIYRLVSTNPPPANAFDSHATLGKVPRGKYNTCRWASCSLVFDPVAHIKRWPRLRDENAFACELSIPDMSGMSATLSDPNHIDFWCSTSFSMPNAVKSIISLPKVI